MSKEYIERGAAVELCSATYKECLRKSDWCGDTAAWNIGFGIKQLPAADVVEVKHGRWVVDEADVGEVDGYPAYIEFHCPICNEQYSLESGQYDWFYGDDVPFKFCHECGCKMDGGADK